MKIQNLFLTLIATAAIVVGCNPKEEEQPSLPVLTVGQTEVSFEQGGGTASVTVTSNRPWTITSDADWLAFNPSNGTASSAPVNVTVTALANSSNDRTASFRVKTDFDYKTINVSQKGAKGEDTTDKPSGDGTKDNPYNPAGVVAYVNTLTADTDSPNVVYVTGKISEVTTTYEASGTYGNATFYISEDGSKTLTQFYVFQTYYLGNKKWKSGQTDVKVGDSVTICGKVVNYKGKTPETVGKAGSYVCTLNGTTEYGDGGGDQPEAKGKGTLEDPFNPSAAANAVADLTWTDSKNYQTTDNVYVKGKISRIAENGTYTEGGTYGNASFYIVEEGTDFEFYVFRALYLGNKRYASGQTDIKVGDEVIIYGKLMNYHGNTPETEAGSCYLYSLNDETGGGDQPGGDTEEVKTATIAEFLAAPDSKTQPYKLTGKVSNIKSDVYGNFDLTDASGTVYVYGLVSKDLGGYDQNKNKNDKSFA
ncbi:MAG: BACON domain-containing protein, partial [Bacteroidales bacterium]|nr:BACON domain-containing protein [Bacteroidales bacterium]